MLACYDIFSKVDVTDSTIEIPETDSGSRTNRVSRHETTGVALSRPSLLPLGLIEIQLAWALRLAFARVLTMLKVRAA